jgi:hypothetical protein
VIAECRDILAAGGYEVGTREVAGTPILLAETLYALVMVVEVPEDEVERFVEEAQAQLTQLAATHPSPRRWDLYLVLVVEGNTRRYHALREHFLSDTRYARKLVVTDDNGRLEQLLRPLLPLRPLPDIALEDPLAAVRRQLRAEDIDPDLIDVAVRSFERTGEVTIT